MKQKRMLLLTISPDTLIFPKQPFPDTLTILTPLH